MSRSVVLLAAVLLIALGLALCPTCGPGSPRAEGVPDAGAPAEAPVEARAAVGDSGPRRAVVESSEAVRAEAPAPPTAPAADPAPILVAGTVTDPDGRPVAGAAILCQEIEIPPGEGEGEGQAHFGMRIRSLRPRDDVEARSDDAGRFVARGTASGRLEVGAELLGRVLREVVECAPGTTDVVLVLERAGSLRATLTADSVALERRVWAEVRPAGVSMPIDGSVSAFDGGAMQRDGLRAGYYDLVIRGRNGAATLWKAEGIAVLPDRITEDPRLLAIDLASVLRPIRITVVDPRGQPVEKATVMVYEGQTGRGQRTDADGRIELVGAADGLCIEVRAEGWRLQRLADVRADARVELRPLLELELRCRDASAHVPLDGEEQGRLAVCLEEADREAEEGRGAWGSGVGSDTLQPKPVPGDPGEAVRFRLDRPGRYRVWWAVGLGGGEAEPPREWVHVHPDAPLWIDLDDVAGAQVREVTFDEGLVGAAQERVRAMRESGRLRRSRRE